MGRSSRVLFFVAFAALPIIAACNAIIGIDDFKRTECGAKPCEFEGGPDVIGVDNFVPDSGKDTAVDAPPGIGPVSWAEFPMPNYKPDSGLISDRPLKYNPTGDPDIIEDDYTKLPWRRAVIGGALGTDFFQDDARAQCQKLANGPWRLPKRIELVTLLSYGTGAPFIDRDAFPGFPSDVVWTSSEVRNAGGVVTNKFWAIDFKTGQLVQLDGKVEGAKALCVKDKQ